MAEFTPGKWAAQKMPKPIGSANWQITFADDGEMVAEVVYEEADAKLMAAAKEMYEALKVAFKVMLDGSIEQQVNALKLIELAIDKAEGRE